MTVVSDAGFEDLVSDISSRSKLDRGDLLKLIQEKKSKVGAGYLTDQGALFLVASDLGVSVDYDPQRPASVAQLESDSRSVSVVGRLLSLGIPKSFTRKGDSSKGLLSKLVIYDSSGAAAASLWDSAVTKILDPALGLKPGDFLKISDAYTRAGLDGKAELNVGEKGKFEKLAEAGKKIDPLENLVIAPSNISDGGRFLIVRGKIFGEIRKSSFSRSDGSTSNLISFSIADELGTGNQVRVVIWNNSSPSFDRFHDGDVVTVLNVRTKISTYQNTASLEIHGDETTNILEFFDETRAWMLEKSKEFAPSSSGAASEEKTAAPARPMPFIGRVISKRYSQNDKKYHVLLIDSQKRKVSVVAADEATKNLGEVEIDSVVVCKPDSLDQSSLRANCNSANSISRVGAKRPDIPLSSSLVVKVEEIPATEGAVVSLELICLSAQPSREIQTKEGLVKRSELTVADHTGEVKVFGWRNLSKLLEDFSAGDRVLLNAVETQIFEGRKFLLLKNYSTVEKKPITA